MTPRGARVLVVGTDEWAIGQGADALSAAGFDVARCHDPGQPTFPCRALQPGGVCPLADGCVAVLDIRARPTAVPDANEFGVVCAVREHVPVVLGGITEGSPFGPWADAVVVPSGDVASAVEGVFAH